MPDDVQPARRCPCGSPARAPHRRVVVPTPAPPRILHSSQPPLLEVRPAGQVVAIGIVLIASTARRPSWFRLVRRRLSPGGVGRLGRGRFGTGFVPVVLLERTDLHLLGPRVGTRLNVGKPIPVL